MYWNSILVIHMLLERGRLYHLMINLQYSQLCRHELISVMSSISSLNFGTIGNSSACSYRSHLDDTNDTKSGLPHRMWLRSSNSTTKALKKISWLFYKIHHFTDINFQCSLGKSLPWVDRDHITHIESHKYLVDVDLHVISLGWWRPSTHGPKSFNSPKGRRFKEIQSNSKYHLNLNPIWVYTNWWVVAWQGFGSIRGDTTFKGLSCPNLIKYLPDPTQGFRG